MVRIDRARYLYDWLEMHPTVRRGTIVGTALGLLAALRSGSLRRLEEALSRGTEPRWDPIHSSPGGGHPGSVYLFTLAFGEG